MDSFDKAPVVILSSIEWDAAWQRHQVFAAQWAAAGHEVFFVENTGFRNPSLRDSPRLWRKAVSMALGKSHKRHLRPPANLHVVNPLVLPPTLKAFRHLNTHLFVLRLIEQLRRRGLKAAPIVVAYLPTATTLEILKHLRPGLTVYDCVGNFSGLPRPPRNLAATEKALVEASDTVVTDSHTLYEDKSRVHHHVLELHHGVSPEFFIPPPSNGSYRRLCYFGTLWRAIDYEPVRVLARAGFEVELIGPRKEAPPSLPRGVTLRGAVPYRQLPALLSDCDALLLPYANNEFSRGVIPAKMYECLATGRPIVASPLPALEGFGDLIYRAEKPADWVEIVRNLPQTESEELIRARIQRAREHLQGEVFTRLQEELRRAWKRKYSASPPPARHAGFQKLDMGFLRGLSWIGLLYGAAKASTLSTQVAAGRWLGPTEYGRANLVMAAAAYVQLLPMLGFPLAISKILADEKEEAARRNIISTSLYGFLIWAGVWLAVLGATGGLVARTFGIPLPLYALSVVYAYSTTFYTVVSSPLLGLRRFDTRGMVEGLYGFSAPLILAVLILLGRSSYQALIAALCLSLAAGTLYSLRALRPFLTPAFDVELFKSLFRYALVATLHLLAVACILGPARLILHRSDSPQAVGIFSAYFTSTAQISLALLYMLTAVLVPSASDASGQLQAWRTFKRIGLPLWLASWGFFVLTAGVALRLFGRQYPFHGSWAVLFAAAASLIMVQGIAAALYSARDFAGLCVAVTASLIAGFANVGLGLALIPRWGIAGAGAGLLGSQIIGLSAYALYSLIPGKAAKRNALPSFEKAPIVILSSIEWDAAWQRHQIFASGLAAAGREVFFVENTAFRNLLPSDLPRLLKKLSRMVSPRTPEHPPALPASLHLVNPLVLPPTLGAFRRANALLFVPRLVEELRDSGLKDAPIVIAYLPTATTLQILDRLQPALTVYDCVENFSGHPLHPGDLGLTEKALVARSELVLTTSHTLYEEKSKIHPHVIELHQGVSPQFFIPSAASARARRLCYFGTLWQAIDYGPIRALAEAGLEVDLIGPRKEAPPPLPPGVTLRNPIAYWDLPQALSAYDVLLLPYARTEYNRGVVPAKIFECLATGKPVISSPLPALEPFRSVIYTAATPADWVTTVLNLPQTESEGLRQARVRLAREHTHAYTFARLSEVLWGAWRRKYPGAGST